MDEIYEAEAWYSSDSRVIDGSSDVIKIGWGPIGDRSIKELDIRDAVFLHWQLTGAIEDYARAVRG